MPRQRGLVAQSARGAWPSGELPLLDAVMSGLLVGVVVALAEVRARAFGNLGGAEASLFGLLLALVLSHSWRFDECCGSEIAHLGSQILYPPPSNAKHPQFLDPGRRF